MLKLTINDSLPVEAVKKMYVKELRDSLADFNQAATVTVAIPQLGKPHEVRAIRVVGHLDHPGEVKNAPDHPGALDVVCDHWDQPDTAATTLTIADLVKAVKPYPDPMHVRVAVPMAHASISHRMLDIVMVGRATGTGGGAGIQVICESWDFPNWIIKEIPEAAARRVAEGQAVVEASEAAAV